MKKSMLLLLAVLAAACSSSDKEPEYTVAVSFLVGNVKINGAEASIGDKIIEGDVISTEALSSCDVKLGSSIIRIKEKSVMKFTKLDFTEVSENTVLGLDKGKLLCKPKKLMKDESFTVKTPTAVAAVRGTQFTVEADAEKTTRINVYDGKVKVMRRVPSLEKDLNKVIESASVIDESESVVITKEETDKAETAVAESMKTESAQDAAKSNASLVYVGTKEISSFKPGDFAFDRSELIKVKEKPTDLVAALKTAMQYSRKKAGSPSQLYLTDKDVYLIKDGKIDWEGELTAKPITMGDKTAVAANDRVIFMTETGNVIWQFRIAPDSVVSSENGKLFIAAGGKKREINLKTGRYR